MVGEIRGGTTLQGNGDAYEIEREREENGNGRSRRLIMALR